MLSALLLAYRWPSLLTGSRRVDNLALASASSRPCLLPISSASATALCIKRVGLVFDTVAKVSIRLSGAVIICISGESSSEKAAASPGTKVIPCPITIADRRKEVLAVRVLWRMLRAAKLLLKLEVSVLERKDLLLSKNTSS